MGIKKNYTYSILYQLIIMFLPLLTVPYISRVLGSEGVGISSFTNSIMQYFLLAGTLGVSLYGSRTIAYVRDNKFERSTTFWEIFLLITFSCIIAFIFFVSYIIFWGGKYQFIYLAQTLNLIGAFLDISWFFTGLEEFKKLVSRNFIVRILSVILIFVLVKKSSDVWKYVVLLGGTSIVGSLVMWVYVPIYVSRPLFSTLHPLKHLRDVFKLFVPQIAIQVYIILNKTILGILTTPSQVGVFAQSEKVIKMSLALVTATGAVMLPRISNTLAQGERVKANYYISKSFQFASFLSIPMAIGLIGISYDFVPWFFGLDFVEARIVIPILSIILVSIAWSNVIGIQFMIPLGEEKNFGLSVVYGAGISLGFNLLLIPRYEAIGAAVATAITELSVTAFQVYFMRNILPLKSMFHGITKDLSAALIMLGAIEAIRFIWSSHSFLFILFQITVGSLSYFLALFALKSPILIEIINQIKSRFPK